MAIALAPEVMADPLAVSVAQAMAAANRCASERGIDIDGSLVTISQHLGAEGMRWRINFGPRDYVGRRGGDLLVEIDPRDSRVTHVLLGQ